MHHRVEQIRHKTIALDLMPHLQFGMYCVAVTSALSIEREIAGLV